MRVLRLGSVGEDVRSWEYFLRGLDFYIAEVDGVFDATTVAATKAFQKKAGLKVDGVAGRMTFGAAGDKRWGGGFNPLLDTDTSKEGPNWPQPSSGLIPLRNNEERAIAWGRFNYKASPVKGNPENILILDNWAARNIVPVSIPQLGAIGKTTHYFHRDVAQAVQELFQAWEEAGLIKLIRSWDGAFVPRFIRGSTTSLSNHSWGTAFDINYRWNGLGAEPALVGEDGSVRELVPIAGELGWYWGGFFTRKDGMHFEATAKVKPSGP